MGGDGSLLIIIYFPNGLHHQGPTYISVTQSRARALGASHLAQMRSIHRACVYGITGFSPRSAFKYPHDTVKQLGILQLSHLISSVNAPNSSSIMIRRSRAPHYPQEFHDYDSPPPPEKTCLRATIIQPWISAGRVLALNPAKYLGSSKVAQLGKSSPPQ